MYTDCLELIKSPLWSILLQESMLSIAYLTACMNIEHIIFRGVLKGFLETPTVARKANASVLLLVSWQTQIQQHIH